MPDREPPPAPWHALDSEAVAQQLQTGRAGLASDEAARRLETYGPNELTSGHQVSAWAILLAQFKNVLLVILILATILSAMLGHEIEAIVIGVIVVFAVLLGFFQEYRAERAMEALREMAAPNATVIRDGEETDLPAREIVPGDVVLLQAGDKVPADARLIESFNLQAEEAALTGESVPSEKTIATLAGQDLPVGDRKNMVYSGTAVTYGRGRAIAVATGMNTEFGQIATMLQKVEEGKTPLQENLDKVGKTLARVALVIVAVIVSLGLWRGESFLDMLIFGIALAVAVVPEALPAVVTISLAIGVQRMVKRNALVRRLPAVETLGSTSVICSDKTGTLTKDEMTVRRFYVAGQMYDVSGAGYEPHGDFLCEQQKVTLPEVALELLRGCVLCSDAHLAHVDSEQRWHVHGDPTEGALVVVAAKAGLHKGDLDREFPRQGEIPFSSDTKRMTTLHQTPGGMVAYSKGAPELMLDSCVREFTEQSEQDLTPQRREAILQAGRQMAEQALRVLAVARKSTSSLDDAHDHFTLLGLLGMIDPPRSEAKAALQICQEAGIKVVMITGDHPITAKAVAQELGLVQSGRVVTGKELDAIDDEQLAIDVEEIDVYARVSPGHKLRVVSALQKQGHIVAMTGDGVNDAPALKKADIGIAMGITGTDVTKEAADVLLLDDNFASIVAAVDEGRGIFGNIKKYLMYLLSANVGEIGLMASASALGLPLPLSAVQILYVNLATDGLPALALAVDPPEPDLMKRPPRESHTGIFTPPVVRLMTVGGIWSALVNTSLYASCLWYFAQQDLEEGAVQSHAMTMTFVSLVLIEFFKAYSFRSDHLSVFDHPLANRWLDYAILWELVLLVLIVYVPFLQYAFQTQPLSWQQWLVITACAFTIVPVLELTKWLERKGMFGGRNHAERQRGRIELREN
jgi:Ca2+-transporting ATPase